MNLGRDTTNVAASALAQRLREAGQSVSQVGNLLEVGQHQLLVEQQIEGEAERAGKWIVGVGVQITLDGKPLAAMRSGGVGVDTTRESAVATAADEWSQEFGVVLVSALFSGTSAAKREETAHFKVYSGPVGLRGQAPIQSFEALRPHLTKGIATFVAGAPTNEWHGVTVTVAYEPRQGMNAMCQVDGTRSPALGEAVMKLPWPGGANSYMFKQFYLAVPR